MLNMVLDFNFNFNFRRLIRFVFFSRRRKTSKKVSFDKPFCITFKERQKQKQTNF